MGLEYATYKGVELDVKQHTGIQNEEFACSEGPEGRERVVMDVHRDGLNSYRVEVAEDTLPAAVLRFRVELSQFLLDLEPEWNRFENRLTLDPMKQEIRKHHPFHVRTSTKQREYVANHPKHPRTTHVYSSYEGGRSGFWQEIYEREFWDWYTENHA